MGLFRFGMKLIILLVWVTVAAVGTSFFWWIGAVVLKAPPQSFQEVLYNAWWAILVITLVWNVFLLLTGKKTAFD